MGNLSQAPNAAVAEASQAPAAVPDKHPPALWFFFWGEFAERSSYYGMRAILMLYLTNVLLFPATTAGPIYSWFKMACYFLPLVGGFLGDRLGRYWVIVGFSVPYVLGHFILGIQDEVALFIALGLLAGGSGVIKPNISTLMGHTYDVLRPGNKQLRSAAFQWFYFSINVGSLISIFSMPWIRTHYGYRIAFLFPAFLMVLSLVTFALGKPYYAPQEAGRPPRSRDERRQQWQTFFRLMGIFALIVFFWTPYEQNDSQWVLFNRDYVHLSVPLLGTHMDPDQIQFLNPLFVLILIPFFIWLFRLLDPEVRVFTPMTKILLGFIFTAAASGLMATAGFLSQASQDKVSIIWVAMAYIILTVGEVLLYGTALELAYAAAPKNMQGFVTACFLLTNTLGNLINSGLGLLYGGSLTDPPETRGPLLPGQFFLLSACIAMTAGFLFYFVGRRFTRAQRAAEASAPA
jgi:POT family proton-dependent oligopeptide transporter